MFGRGVYLKFAYCEENIAEVGVVADQSSVAGTVKKGNIDDSLVRVSAVEGRKRADTASYNQRPVIPAKHTNNCWNGMAYRR